MILREINTANFQECIKLSVDESQKAFVASNLYSLAQAKADGISEPFAIYDHDTMVGFIMYEYEEEENTGWISRLMIDKRFQGKGFGKSAMLLAIEKMKLIKGITHIKTSFVPGNEAAKKLYTGIGFHMTGIRIDGEDICEMKLDKR